MKHSFKSQGIGYQLQRNPDRAVFLGRWNGAIVLVLALATFVLAYPFKHREEVVYLFEFWHRQFGPGVYYQVAARFGWASMAGAVSGCLTYAYILWRTPLSEPFRQVSSAHPMLLRGAAAREDLQRRLFDEAGAGAEKGIYLAPHLALPRSAETKNILLMASPNSGKSNIARALADQVIERGDRVLMLCNKGDVTASFSDEEAVLIAAHHRDSFALDLAADVDDVAAAQQFAADIVPASTPPFWSDSARAILTDIIQALQIKQTKHWTAETLLRACLMDADNIRRGINVVPSNAGSLLESSDPDGQDKTVQSILLTLRTAAFANLRPLALAWKNAPIQRRFSVKRWLSHGYAGPRTVIVQYSSDYRSLSTLVAGNLLRRTAARLADPQLTIDPARRVVLIMDEFHLLDRIEALDAALAVGREKGLVLIVGIQSVNQLIDTYGEVGANKLLDLFGIKIFGPLPKGDAADRVCAMLGTREVSAKVVNRAPAKEDPRLYIKEQKTIPVFSAAQLATQLGIFRNREGTGNVRALVQCQGQAYILDWPFTTWRKKRPGVIPAPWLTSSRPDA